MGNTWSKIFVTSSQPELEFSCVRVYKAETMREKWEGESFGDR